MATDTAKMSRTMLISPDTVFDTLPTSRSARLEISCPGQSPVQHVLDGKDVLLGRGEDCTLSLPLPNVSFEHAKVRKHGEDYVIEDLESTNGTFINNVRVSRCILRNHDHIRIGAVAMEFILIKTRANS